jgi:hypothetical protein
MRRGTMLLGVVCVLAVAPACRADLLSSTISFNPQTQLYTYHYTVTNTTPDWLQEFDIRVGPTPAALTAAAFANPARPEGTASAAGWIFNAAVLPARAYSGGGTYWSWFYPAGISPGTTVSGFSFTTPAPPAVAVPGGMNYYGGFEFPPPPPGSVGLPLGWYGSPGQIIAPALSAAQISDVSAAPEPSALLLVASALLGLASRARRELLHL